MPPKIQKHNEKSSKQLKLKKIGNDELRRGKASAQQSDSLHPHTKRWIVAIGLFAISALAILSLFNMAGGAGEMFNRLLALLFGRLSFIVPILLIGIGILMTSQENLKVKLINHIGVLIFILSLTGLLNIFVPLDQLMTAIDQGQAGGYVGLVFSYAFLNIMGFWASLIVVLALLVIGLLLMLNTTLDELAESPSLLGRMTNWIQIHYYDWKYGDNTENTESRKIVEEEDERQAVSESDSASSVSDIEDVKFHTKQLAHAVKSDSTKNSEPVLEKPKNKIHYKKVDLPLELLEMSSGKPSSGNIMKAKERIQKTLESFNIPVVMGEVNVGPTVTQYEMIPAEGIKLSRITALQDDLALALAAHPIRMEAPIPGKSAVGIEVPNVSAAIVRLRELLDSPTFKKRTSNLEMPMGKDVSGKTWTYSLEKAPHVLVAGATGSGKSVCLNTIIVSLLYQNSPETLRFIMVDPKRVELTTYENIPHLLTPVVTDVKKTVNALKWAVAEMDRRYILLQKMGKRNISSYNQISQEKMPYIVFVIDEMADLMVAARNDVETLIIRLAQMARAVGIHLILATQRPSVDVITGLIKANVPTRIAFAVASSMDSRTILDAVGADKLIGKGDMLFSSPELSKPVRLQGAYLSDDEIKKVVDYLQASGQQPDFDPTITSKASSTSGGVDYSDSTDGDELFEEAKSVVVEVGRASTSLLQRKLKVGYSRAARLMDLLEEAGVVSAADGAKPREILVMDREVESQGFDVAEEELQPVFDEDVDANENSKIEVRRSVEENVEEDAQIPESEPLFVSKSEPVEDSKIEDRRSVEENDEEVDEEEIPEKEDELTEDELEAIESIDETETTEENKEEADDWSK